MKKRKFKKGMPLKLIASLAMLSAISIILGKYMQIPMGNVMRFSFENLPILFAGIAFGPISGLLTGAVADLVGCLLVGYEINPVITVGAAMCGGVSGLVSLVFRKSSTASLPIRIISSVTLAHLVASVVIKTVGLAVYYDMPIGILMLWRLLNYVIVGVLECTLLIILMKNRGVTKTVGIITSNRPEGRNED